MNIILNNNNKFSNLNNSIKDSRYADPIKIIIISEYSAQSLST